VATNQANLTRFDDGPLTYIDGMLCIDGLPLDRIVAETGTPAYVYSADAVTSRYQETADAFAPLDAHLFYAIKANSNLGLLRLLARLGSGFEVVSGGELTRVLRAGGDATKVVFSGVGKTRAELGFAVEQGVLLLVESADELDALQAVAAGAGTRARFALRVNPDVTVDTHHHIRTGHDAAKFGVPVALARELLERAAAKGFPDLDPAGVHIHIGSQQPDPSGMVDAARIALGVLRAGRDAGLELDVLNVGGGFPVAYDGGEAPGPEVFATALEPVVAGADVRLGVEPGRSLVARAGVLIAQVLYRKHRDAGRMLVLDTGMHQLLRPALYEAVHRFKPLAAGEPAGPTELVGPICESTDVLGVSEDLPDLQPGDLVAILDAGAYGMTMASNYNSHPRPPEIVVEHGVARVTRRRETWDDLLAAERHANSVGTVLPSRAIRQQLRVDHTAEFKAVDVTEDGGIKH
jgi:diaminopimelate decarboxylase